MAFRASVSQSKQARPHIHLIILLRFLNALVSMKSFKSNLLYVAKHHTNLNRQVSLFHRLLFPSYIAFSDNSLSSTFRMNVVFPCAHKHKHL